MWKGTIRWLDVMNEYIDSTVGCIPVCLLCSLLVTIRGLVGPFRRILDFYCDFLWRISCFHPICFFVYILYLTGTWWVIPFTGLHRLYLTKYRRNRVNFVFFTILVWLILRGQWGWFWRKFRSWGFPYRLICHLGPLYHYHVSFTLGDLHHF